jgi:hypothetical protein
VSSVLSFGFLFLVAHPKVQRMVQEEIDSIIGDASPTMEHGKRMPYTQVIFVNKLKSISLQTTGHDKGSIALC